MVFKRTPNRCQGRWRLWADYNRKGARYRDELVLEHWKAMRYSRIRPSGYSLYPGDKGYTPVDSPPEKA